MEKSQREKELEAELAKVKAEFIYFKKLHTHLQERENWRVTIVLTILLRCLGGYMAFIIQFQNNIQ